MTRWTAALPAAATAAITLTAALPAVAATPLPRATGQAHSTRGKAVNLRLTERTRHQLADAFYKQYYGQGHPGTRGRVDGPKHVYYGKIRGASAAKDVYWAIGSVGVKGDPVSYQDGPHIWRKRGNHGWEYRGDTGGCVEGGVPKALLQLWRFPACGFPA
ncbi:hypothetical protein DI270_008390 [Microbispora triticiradicis]|uniref:Peptidase M23 n=1 Tax=Microbispora triticiradicis TaxID=2200763 RepID=A0ABX9LND7_9ACTN|nr:hypothetical protein [Microbispora triticiradicis]RGA05467.1 hypothetical protein DI270_008390 [Microbispora triticiradicis]GLW21672.1 hypothetical protein Mame01_17150 [Microbispora amethystogenes]